MYQCVYGPSGGNIMIEVIDKKHYKFGELIPMTTKFANDYLSETDETLKQFHLTNLILAIDLPTMNLCKKFRHKNPKMDLEVVHALCISTSLLSALEHYDKEKDFLALYYTVMERDIISYLRTLKTEKARFNDSVLSGDAEHEGADGVITLFDSVSDNKTSGDIVCDTMVLHELLEEFANTDIHGHLIKFEMYGNRDDRTSAIVQFLGAEEYGPRERKIVQRTKERFKKFLVEKDFDYASYLYK